ncbi:MAG: hypothetical protein H6698_03195 [Myxococcales bacterium]|nr:hypothetical protein [Myxococcales bacterium]
MSRVIFRIALAAIALCGCVSEPDPARSPGAVPPRVEAPEPAAAAADPPGTETLGDGSTSPTDEAVAAEPPAPEPIPPRPASAAAELGVAGGAIVAGEVTVDFQEGALAEPTVLDVRLFDDPDGLGRPLPRSTTLAALRVATAATGLQRTARITVPLTHRLEPGTLVELLAWQPAMAAFMVVDDARVDDTGRRAEFQTRTLGDLLVRAAPIEHPAPRCDGGPITMFDAWPGGSEDEVVGLTEVEQRLPRDLAFNVLSDFRLSPHFDRVEFKNEEVNDSNATRADERDHRDEDFLMDPNAAAALATLAELVLAEWRDPVSGGPAVSLRVTEAFDSLIEHQTRSSHYQGRAIDLTLSPVPAATGDERRAWYGRLARLAVCAGFDYVLFENQYHVHASVVPTRLALAFADTAADDVAVETAALWRPDGRTRHPRTWHLRPVDVAAVRWDAPGLVGLVTREELASRPDADAVRDSPDGLRRVVVVNGQAFLVNTGPMPPLGSVNADGTPVDVHYPFPLPSDGAVVAGGFSPHGRSALAAQAMLQPR